PPISTLFPYTTLFRSRRRSLLLRFLVRSLAVCGFSGGRLLGPYLFDVVETETRGNFGPGAGDGYRAAHRCRHVQAGRALAVVGRSEEHTSELQSRFDL